MLKQLAAYRAIVYDDDHIPSMAINGDCSCALISNHLSDY